MPDCSKGLWSFLWQTYVTCGCVTVSHDVMFYINQIDLAYAARAVGFSSMSALIRNERQRLQCRIPAMLEKCAKKIRGLCSDQDWGAMFRLVILMVRMTMAMNMTLTTLIDS